MKSKIDLRPNQTIVFTGDSITDAGRCEPAYKPLGLGYVHFAANMLLARYPELNLSIINTGIGGNTVRDLKARWEMDCIRHKPDILSILIGVNDLWRQYVGPERLPESVYPDEYQATYRHLLSQAKQKCNCQLVIMEPFMFCSDFKDPMFEGLRAYIEIVGKLAEDFDAVLVPLQGCIDKIIKQVPPERWSDDMVHPYLWAHAWIAQRWLEVVSD